MKGVIFDKAGDAAKVVDTLHKPTPSADQILVKSLYTAINPVYLNLSWSDMSIISNTALETHT